MKQYANNACGTVGVLHAFLNLIEKYPHLVQKDSFLDKFYQETIGKNSDERGHYLVQSKDLEEAHKEAVEKGVIFIFFPLIIKIYSLFLYIFLSK